MNEIFNLTGVIQLLTNGAEAKIDKFVAKGKGAASQVDLIGKAANESSTKLDGLGTKGANLGNVLKTAFSLAAAQALKFAGGAVLGAVASALTAVGTTALVMGRQIHDASVTAQAALGLTSDKAKDLSRDIADIWLSSTADVATVTDALIEVRRNMKDAGDETERLTKLMLDFAKVNKTDVGASTKDAAGLLRAYKLEAKDLPAALDAITAVSQSTGAPAAEILKGLPQARTYTAGTGTSLQQDAAMLGTVIQTGGDVGALRGGLQTLGEATVAPTEEQIQAFNRLGVSLNEAGQPLNGLAGAWDELTEAARKGQIEGAGAQTAFMKLFGEDDSAQILTAMRSIRDGYDELVKKATDSSGTVAESAETLKSSFGEGLQTLFRETIGDLGVSLGTFLSGPASQLLQWSIDAVQAGKKLAAEGFAEFGAYLQKSFPALIKAWERVGPELKKIWDTFAQGFGDLVDSMGVIWNAFTSAVSETLGPMLKLLDPFLASTATALTSLLKVVNLVLDGAARIGAALGAASHAIDQNWNKMTGAMATAWQNLAQMVKDVWADALEFVLAGIEKLPAKAQEALGAKNLRGQIDNLRTANRPQRSVQDSVQDLTEAGGNIIDGIFGAWTAQDERKKQQAMPKPAPAPKEKPPGVPLGVPKPDADGGPDPEAEATRKRLAAERIKEQADAVQRDLSLNKISEQAGIQRYRAIMQEARAANLEAKDLYAVERALFDLQKDLSDRAKDAAEKSREATEKARVERIKLVQGETAGLLAALEIEKRERAKAGAEALELEAWYSAQRIAIFAADAKQREEQYQREVEAAKKRADAENALVESRQRSEQDLLETQERTLQAQLAAVDQQLAEQIRALDQQRQALLDANGDRLQAQTLYEDAVLAAQKAANAKKLKLEEEDAKARLKVQQDLQTDILRAQAQASDDPAKKAKLNNQADNAERLEKIKSKVEAAQKAGVDPSVVREYLRSEQQAILAGDQTEQQEAKPDFYSSIGGDSQGSSGFSLPTFSNTSRRRRGATASDKDLARQVGALGAVTDKAAPSTADPLGANIGGLLVAARDPAARIAAGKMGANVGAIAASSKSPQATGINDTLTIKIVEEGGRETFAETARRGGPDVSWSTSYTPGRLGSI